MTTSQRLARLAAGAALVLATVAVAFAALIFPWIPNWNATPQEVARVYPGDERVSAPQVLWTHGITINAPPEAVWPWVAQLGEGRGAFYSYTFVENAFSLVGGGPSDAYRNANTILPEFQDIKPGDTLIGGMFFVDKVEPGRYLLGMAKGDLPFGWTWLWELAPAGEGQTRLLVRTRIKPEEGADSPIVGAVITAGGFVMERRMMTGLRDRAEGRPEPGWYMPAEVVLWFVALGAGLAAAVVYLRKRRWLLPLLVGEAAVVALLVFTYLQPALWLRALVDVALLAGVVVAARQP